MMYQTPANEVPPVLYGAPMDKNQVIINSRGEFKDVIKHIEYGSESSQTFENTEKLCIEMLKYWYLKHNKDYLNFVLDEYARRSNSQMIKNYANVMHYGNNHWILLVANLSSDEENFTPHVYTIDNMTKSDNDAYKTRKWYAKFFGLYVKEHNAEESFTDDDFDCHEFIREHNDQSQGDDGTSITKSYLDHEPREREIIQLDGYNCGVISLIQCIELFNGIEMFKSLEGEEHHLFLLGFRLRMLSLIRDLYDLFNEKHYKTCKDHMYMEEGDPSKPAQLGKFYMIHQLFNKNVYTYKLKAKFPKAYCNANSVSKRTNYDVIKAQFKEHCIDDYGHPVEVNELFQQSTPKKKKSAKSSTSKKGNSTPSQKKNVASVFYTEDDDFPISTVHVSELVQGRSGNVVTDVNNVKLQLDPEVENVASATDRDNNATHPRDMVSMLIELFKMCYLTDRLIEIKKRKFVKDVKELMFRHSTYFIVDLIKEQDSEKCTYGVIAAVIFEHTVHLDFVKHSMLHLIAICPGYEGTGHINKLLFLITNTTRLKTKKLIIIT